ncbi:hypothetical protein C7999DRAFT_31483 [Corynascus novoguineensis]|uniref:Rhodopsin domain-containing protein n=1 Tax=Corynascus novoguineensis TaxID=1126955 RepID=A0AAN7CW85_9PEZI|nr:hypothetical protein C7999DRAFT_31483 [Corynascus novoguineensis]
MSTQVISEPGYTKFNLTYPAVTGNATPSVDLSGGDMRITGALSGILVPHIVCTLLIIARAYSRFYLLQKWFLDDSLILVAWAIITAVCIIYSTIAAQPESRLDNLSNGNNTTSAGTIPLSTSAYSALILYQLALLLTKLSTLSFYHRIFSFSSSEGPNKRPPAERTLTRLTTLVVLLHAGPLLALSILQCHQSESQHSTHSPFSYPKHQEQDRCAGSAFTDVPLKPLLITSAALHAATDAWLVALILPCVARLRGLPRQRKAVLGAVLGLLSALVVAAGIARLAVVLQLLSSSEKGGESGIGRAPVAVAETAAFFVVTVLELDVAVICASAPTLRPVLARVWPRLLGEHGLGEGKYLARRRGVGVEERGVSLTSVVRCYERPWTTGEGSLVGMSSGTKAVGKGASGLCEIGAVQRPPAVATTHRPPTMLSLRSFVNSMSPWISRPRGRSDWDDGAGLLREERRGGDGRVPKYGSSIGLEVHYEQLVGYGDSEKKSSRCIARAAERHSEASYHYRDSQESLVLGVNDPNSPKRRNPVSRLDKLTEADVGTGIRGDEGALWEEDGAALGDLKEQGESATHGPRFSH